MIKIEPENIKTIEKQKDALIVTLKNGSIVGFTRKIHYWKICIDLTIDDQRIIYNVEASEEIKGYWADLDDIEYCQRDAKGTAAREAAHKVFKKFVSPDTD